MRGADADVLTGNEGFNIYWGGDGADVFRIGRGVDLVEDFNLAEGDTIEMVEPIAAICASVSAHVVDYSGTLVNGQTISGTIVCETENQARDFYFNWMPQAS